MREDNDTTVRVSITDNIVTFEEQREKFKKEARRISMLTNEHIVGVHDLFEENGTAYYVMDYIDGESLSKRLKRTGTPLSEGEALDLLSQILDALDTAHNINLGAKTGILHLDLKPANIMVDRQGRAKLIDFGASKQISNNGGATTSTAISYTMGYAPREQMEQNLDNFGPWTDIYALGATLYTLLTGNKPPMPSSIDDDDSDDKRTALPLPATVSDNTRRLVVQMMQTNHRRRPQSIAAVRALMSTSVVATPGDDVTIVATSATQPETAHTKRRPTKIDEFLIWFVVVLLIVFLIIAGYGLIRNSNYNDDEIASDTSSVEAVDSAEWEIFDSTEWEDNGIDSTAWQRYGMEEDFEPPILMHHTSILPFIRD